MTCGIYMITNKVNGKIYIGQAVDIETRWGEHKRELRSNYHYSKHLQKAWNKYGEDNFEFTIICECDENQLNTMEEYYIFELMTYDKRVGYNKTYGGGSGRPTEETKQKLSKSLKIAMSSPEVRKKISENHADVKGGNNPNYGKRGSENPNSIPVVQLTLDGKLVNVYASAKDAKRSGFTDSSVSRCCRGIYKTFYGYRWMYLHEYKNLSEESIKKMCETNKWENNKGENNGMYGKHGSKNPNSIPVVQLTLDGELVEVYAAAKETGRSGFTPTCITACIKGKKKTHKGYKWMYLYQYISNMHPNIKKINLFGKEYEVNQEEVKIK